jgi:hypothetical protein
MGHKRPVYTAKVYRDRKGSNPMQIYLTADDESGTEKLNFDSDGQNYVRLLSYLRWHPNISQQTRQSQNKVVRMF